MVVVWGALGLGAEPTSFTGVVGAEIITMRKKVNQVEEEEGFLYTRMLYPTNSKIKNKKGHVSYHVDYESQVLGNMF